MPELAAAAQAIVDRLRAAGIPSSLDPATLDLPGVLVDLPELTFRFGKGWTAAWSLVLLAPNTDRETALGNLSALLAQVQVAMESLGVTARAVNVQLPDQGAPVPGYELAFTQRLA